MFVNGDGIRDLCLEISCVENRLTRISWGQVVSGTRDGGLVQF